MRIVIIALLAGLASAGGAAGQTLVQSQDRARCEAQWRALNRRSPDSKAHGDHDGFLKTCLADVNPTAALPSPRLLMQAPVGATGLCRDGSYTADVRPDGACTGHGGLSRWIP